MILIVRSPRRPSRKEVLRRMKDGITKQSRARGLIGAERTKWFMRKSYISLERYAAKQAMDSMKITDTEKRKAVQSLAKAFGKDMYEYIQHGKSRGKAIEKFEQGLKKVLGDSKTREFRTLQEKIGIEMLRALFSSGP